MRSFLFATVALVFAGAAQAQNGAVISAPANGGGPYIPANGGDASAALLRPSGSTAAVPLGTLLSAAPDLRSWGAAENGATDDSAALRKACAALVASGQSRIYIARTTNVPSYGPTDCPDVALVGPGSLSGAYRKLVVPLGAPAPATPLNGIPAAVTAQIKTAAAAATTGSPLKIAIIGDSTSQSTSANGLTASENMWPMLLAQIQSAYPTAPMSSFNFGIGGQTFAQADGVAQSFPTWYTNHASSWLSYVQTYAPDVLIVNFGMNDTNTLSYTQLHYFIAAVRAWSKVPAIVFVTNNAPSLHGVYGDNANQDGRDHAASIIRNFALEQGYGLIDINRQFVQARDGFDPLMQPLALADTNTQFVQSNYTAPVKTYDFAFNVSFPYAFSSSTNFVIPLSSASGNTLVLDRDATSGNLAVTVNGDGSTVDIARFVTSVNIPTSTTSFAMQICAKGGNLSLSVSVNGATQTTIFSQYIGRGGGLFTPSITGTGAAMIHNYIYFYTSTPRPVMPFMSDTVLFGVNSNNTDGNGINHLSSAGIEAIDAPVIAAQRFQ